MRLLADQGLGLIEGALPVEVRARAWRVLGCALAVRVALVTGSVAKTGTVGGLIHTQDGDSNLAIAASFPWVYRGTDQLMHFPGYPFFVWLLGAVMPLEWAAVTLSVVCSSLAAACCYLIGYRVGLGDAAWRGAVLFCVAPFRWLDISIVAMSEGLAVLALCAYVYALICARPAWASLAFAIAVWCRFGNLFFVPLGLVFLVHGDQRRFRHAVVAAMSGVCAILVLCTYFYFVFDNFVLYFETHARLWGGSHFDWPGTAWIAGSMDPSLADIRKLYVGWLLAAYLGISGCALPYLRKQVGLRVVWWWFALGFLPLAILNGASINWGFIAFPRWVLPATPPLMLMLGYLLPARGFRAVAAVATLGGVAYVVWAAHTPHSYYQFDPGAPLH